MAVDGSGELHVPAALPPPMVIARDTHWIRFWLSLKEVWMFSRKETSLTSAGNYTPLDASQAISIRHFLSQHLSGRAGDSTDKSGRPVTREFASRKRCVSWGHKEKFHKWHRRVLWPAVSLQPRWEEVSKPKGCVASKCCHVISTQLENTGKYTEGRSVKHPSRCGRGGGVALLGLVQKP